MFLERSLHFVVASLLVIGMFAITESHAPAVSPPAAAPLALASHSTASLRTATPSPRREVFGFGLASSRGDPTFGYPSWNFSLLSTVAFFGLHINSDGTIVSDSGPGGWNSR